MILVLAMGSEYDQIIFRQASELTTTWSCFDSLSETGFTGFLDVFSVNMKSSVVDLCCAHQVLLLAHFIQGVPEITIWELRTRLNSFVFPLAFRCHYWVLTYLSIGYLLPMFHGDVRVQTVPVLVCFPTGCAGVLDSLDVRLNMLLHVSSRLPASLRLSTNSAHPGSVILSAREYEV